MSLMIKGRATHAYGILIDDDRLRRRAAVLHKTLRGKSPATTLPEAAREAIDAIHPTALFLIPLDVYPEVPGLPRYRRNILFLNDSRGPRLPVFKDNSSHAALHAPLDLEDVKKAKRYRVLVGRGDAGALQGSRYMRIGREEEEAVG